MKVYAHRGFFDEYPENSVQAIESALASGCSAEVDIRFTKDGRMALIHDRSIKRLCGQDHNVCDLTAKELKQFPLLSNPNEHISMFDDIFQAINRDLPWGFAIHFKQEEQTKYNCEILARSFQKYDLYDNSFILNLGITTCQVFRDLDPSIRLYLLVSDERFEEFVYTLEDIKTVNGDLYDGIWAAEYKQLYEKKFFEQIRASGKDMVVVSHELHRSLGHPKALKGYQDAWGDFIESGVGGICTDYPMQFLDYYSQNIEAYKTA